MGNSPKRNKFGTDDPRKSWSAAGQELRQTEEIKIVNPDKFESVSYSGIEYTMSITQNKEQR
jgi:hypothetical protein